MRGVINVAPYNDNATSLVGEGLAPPETLPLNGVYREANQMLRRVRRLSTYRRMTGVSAIETIDRIT